MAVWRETSGPATGDFATTLQFQASISINTKKFNENQRKMSRKLKPNGGLPQKGGKKEEPTASC